MCITTRRKKIGQLSRLQLLTRVLLLSLAWTSSTYAQRPANPNPLRDVVRSIERKEMDRLLLLKPLPATKNDSAQRAALKQLSEDFRDLQGLNNKMMADAWSRPELDYEYLSSMVSQIRSKATRLKSNLALPEGPTEELSYPEVSDAGAFKDALLIMDRRIMNFVTNPLFQKANVVDVKLAHQASGDLKAVIELSGKLKKTAARLSKSVRPQK